MSRLDRVWKKLVKDSVRIRVPKSFLSTLTLFFHHVSDAMAGDDRPDHGLARMRESREAYKDPFYFLYGTLKRSEKRMTPAQKRKALEQFEQLRKEIEEDEKRFRERLSARRKRKL